MTEEPLPALAPPPAAASSLKRLLRLLAVVVLAALVAAGVWVWQQQTQRAAETAASLDQLRGRIAQLDGRQKDMIEVAQQGASQIAMFDSRLEGYDETVGKLAEDLQGGRVRFQLAAVENLLLSASERVQLHRDARGAIAALELADQRLAALSEPRLFKLREAVAQERIALLAVPQPDRISIGLTLASLIARVPQLPLQARVPEHAAIQEHAPLPEAEGWTQRVWDGAVQALSSVFSLRRNDGPSPRLLAPEQETLVYQMLALKLEGARLALLRNDAASYRDLCDSAVLWLGDYFRASDPGVQSARAELQRLKAVPIDPPLPDVTRSLALLRGYLDNAAQ